MAMGRKVGDKWGGGCDRHKREIFGPTGFGDLGKFSDPKPLPALWRYLQDTYLGRQPQWILSMT